MKKPTKKQIKEINESVKQIKDWDKYGDSQINYSVFALIGVMVVVAIIMIIATPIIINSCN